jgi:hypothetical protein
MDDVSRLRLTPLLVSLLVGWLVGSDSKGQSVKKKHAPNRLYEIRLHLTTWTSVVLHTVVPSICMCFDKGVLGLSYIASFVSYISIHASIITQFSYLFLFYNFPDHIKFIRSLLKMFPAVAMFVKAQGNNTYIV